MPRFRLIVAIGCTILSVPTTGCGLFRAHRPLTVQVIDGDTRQPLPKATVSLCYLNMLDFTAPRPCSRMTDSRGMATLRIGEFHTIIFGAELNGYRAPDHSYFNSEFVMGLPRRSTGRIDMILEMWAEPKATIEFVVPNGYRGPVKVVFEQDDSTFERGLRQFSFPVQPDGRAVVRGPSLLDPHRYSPRIEVRYADGIRIPSEGHFEDNAFRWVQNGTWNGRNTQLFNIGRLTDREVLWQSVHTRSGHNVWGEDREAYNRLFDE